MPNIYAKSNLIHTSDREWVSESIDYMKFLYANQEARKILWDFQLS